jgi:uncharacterized membrane protein
VTQSLLLSLREFEALYKNWLRPKYVVFGIIFLMMVYVWIHNERFVFHSDDPAWKHYETFKWWLLPHILAAASALFLGPMQFSERLRRRYRKLHPVLGRVYVGGALIGAPLGAFIQYRFDERLGMSRSFSISNVVDALLWMIPTTLGLIFALGGKIQQHSQWMTRSYAVAIVFLETRIVIGLGGWQASPANFPKFELVIWINLAFSILLADIAISWQDLWATRNIAAKSVAATGSH